VIKFQGRAKGNALHTWQLGSVIQLSSGSNVLVFRTGQFRIGLIVG
jgi:hypothetical protein